MSPYIPFKVVIPARYGSSRLPGKPLLCLAGKTMVEWVYRIAEAAGAEEVVVASDDPRITSAVERFHGQAEATSGDHVSGTSRIAELAGRRGWPDSTIVVNLQCDEPGLPAGVLHRVASALHERPEVGLSTLAARIHELDELFDPNVVKVVLRDDGMAQYFSRAPIPWVRDAFPRTASAARLPADAVFLRHLGLYAYRVATLRRVAGAEANVHEGAEKLEQLRALALGISIFVDVLDELPPNGVDTPADAARMSRVLAGSRATSHLREGH